MPSKSLAAQGFPRAKALHLLLFFSVPVSYTHLHDSLIMSEQEYQDYKSKYLMLYAKQKKDREVVSVLNDVDFCIELMLSLIHISVCRRLSRCASSEI